MSEADVPNGLRTERVTLEDVIAEPFADSPGASETDRLRADADYLLRLFHGQANDFAEVLSVVGRISARVGRLERMLANSGSASSAAAAEQEAPAASGAADSEIRDGVLALEHMLYVFRDDQRPTVQTRLEKLRRLVELLRDQAPAANVVPSAIAMMIDIITSDSVCVDQDEKHAAMATLVEAVCPGYVLAPAASGAAGTEPVSSEQPPSGYAYEYPHYPPPVATVIRFTGGETINGSKPLRAIPYWFAPQPAPGWLTSAPAASDAAVSADDRQVMENAVTYLLGVGEAGSEPHVLGKSLRLVMTKQVLHAAPAASGAAGTEPDAWGVRRNGLVDCVAHRSSRKSAEGSAEQWGGIVVALYAAPQPAPGWLTAEEWEALKLAADAAYDKQEDTLRSLLARSTPPEVVLPRDCGGESYDSFVAGWNNYRDEALKALAAAGVPVKEVGRE